MSLRIGTFNVENLFSRAKLLDFNDHAVGDQKLKQLDALRAELARSTYDPATILDLYDKLKDYITVNETRGKLFRRKRNGTLELAAGGAGDWDGTIALKRRDITGEAQRNTAHVIREVGADVLCTVEVEDRLVLDQFSRQLLTGKHKYRENMLIDGNDDRGIDVGVLSKLTLGQLRSHIFDGNSRSRVFSRDCLEVQVALPDGRELWILLNHFKSRGYGAKAANDSRRERQARRVVDILGRFDLTRDLVVVAGDFNDTPDSAPIQPLLALPHLHDVVKERVAVPAERWTYRYNKNEQIDYLLVSGPLAAALTAVGIERRGIFDVDKYTGGATKAFPAVTNGGYRASASDHAAVWADFNL